MSRFGYWRWKWEVESLLNKRLDWNEIELAWSMYDRKYSPELAAGEFMNYMKGPQ